LTVVFSPLKGYAERFRNCEYATSFELGLARLDATTAIDFDSSEPREVAADHYPPKKPEAFLGS
jgi:hypothetical protein